MPSSFNAELNVKLNPQSLNASTKQVQQALGRITGQASEFQKSLDASTARVFAFGATTAVLNGVSQSFKKLVSTTVEVEKRLIEINSIFQATETTFNRFRNSIFQVAKETGQAFSTVADGAAELARQGLSAEDTAKRLKASLVLTRISGLDAEKSVKALTAAINGFASAGLTANQIVNKLVAVDTAFAVSAQDLAEAFSRAGSTAEDAGVSFDQLLGLVTAVEQKTARGGAVIGNAFKSIFTRLSRGTTIEELKELGVAIDASQTGIQKLSALSQALENISDPTVASKIKELAGGVFQINVVSAALKDLGSNTSIFKNAALVASTATNEAFEKNAELNKSISAQINTLVQGLTSLSEKIGSITFGPLLESLVGIATKFTEFLDKALDPEKGNVFIKGFFKTIGSFLSGPAIVLFTGAFVKIAGLIAKFAAEGFKSLFQMGTQAERIRNIEDGIVGLLSRDKTLRNVIASTTATQAQKEAAIITAIQRENQLLRDQAALRRSLAASAFAGGVGGFNSGTGMFTRGRGGKAFASGGRVTGGSGIKDDVPAMLTAGEFVMRKSAVDKFGVGFMRQINNGALGMNQGGFVPNYAGVFAKPTLSDLLTKQKGIKFQKRKAAGQQTADDLEVEAEIAKLQSAKKSKDSARLMINPRGSAMLVPQIGLTDVNSVPKGYRGSFRQGAKSFPFEFTSRVGIYGPKVPKAVDQAADPQDERLKKSITRGVSTSAANYAGLLRPALGKPAPSAVLRNMKVQGGGKGALNAIVGAAFEAAVSVGLGISPAKNTEGGDFDIKNQSATVMDDTRKLFGVPKGVNLMDFKVTSSLGNIASFAKKLKNQGRAKTGMKMGGIVPNYAGGPVPSSMIRVHKDPISGQPLAVTNTRDEPRGLRDAIKREKAGIGMTMGGIVPNYAKSKTKKTKKTTKSEESGGGGKGILGLFAIQSAMQMFSASMDQNTTSIEAETEARIDYIKANEKDFRTRQNLLSVEENLAAAAGESTIGLQSFMGGLNIATTALMTLATLKELGGAGLAAKVTSSPFAKGIASGAGAITGGRKLKMRTAERLKGQEGRMLKAQRAGAVRTAGRAMGAGLAPLIAGFQAHGVSKDTTLTDKQKKQEFTGIGAGLAGGIGGAKLGATAGFAVGGPLGSAIGAAAGAIVGGAVGAVTGTKIYKEIFGDPEKEIEISLREAMLSVMEDGLSGDLSFGAEMDEGTFSQTATKNLNRLASSGQDAAAVEKRYRDATKRLAEIRSAQALGTSESEDRGSGAGLLSAERELEAATLELLGVVSLSESERRQHASDLNFAERKLADATKKQARLVEKRLKAMNEMRDASATLLTGAKTASALSGTVTGKASGALGVAASIGEKRAGIIDAQSQMNLAKINLNQAKESGDQEAIAKALDAFNDASKNFADNVRGAGISLQVSIAKAEKGIADINTQIKESFKAEQAARVAAAETTLGQEVDPITLKKELDAIAEALKENDLKSLEQLANDFSGQGLGTREQLFTAEFGKELAQELGNKIIEIEKTKLNEGAKGGLSEGFYERLGKAKGLDRFEERDKLREQRDDLEKQVGLLKNEFERMRQDISTASITSEIKLLKDKMNLAAESFEGVDSYVRAQSEAANNTAKLIEDNATFVIEQKALIEASISTVTKLKDEFDRLKGR